MPKNSRLVFSTDQGRIRDEKTPQSTPKTDGIIRISRETKGRKGSGVVLISGFDLDDKELKALSKKLKQACGSGGTLKDRVIEIQGDHRQTLKETLEKQGFKVKLVGG